MIKTCCLISENPLSLSDAFAFIGNDSHGAQAFFVGTVRNHHNGKAVIGMQYDMHTPLAQTVLQTIADEAITQWGDGRVYLAHRYGELSLGESSVIVAASCAHRDASFSVCRFLIEQIKQRLPVWKKEHYHDGYSTWLPGHTLHASTC